MIISTRRWLRSRTGPCSSDAAVPPVDVCGGGVALIPVFLSSDQSFPAQLRKMASQLRVKLDQPVHASIRGRIRPPGPPPISDRSLASSPRHRRGPEALERTPAIGDWRDSAGPEGRRRRDRVCPRAGVSTAPYRSSRLPLLRGRRSVALSGLSTVAEGGVPAARPQFCASSPASRRTAHASGATAASTSPESVAPASKSSPWTAKTITRCGSRCRARASSIASWSPKAWVDAEPRSRAGSGSLLASNRRIVPGGSPERIVSTITTASRPWNTSSKSLGSHSC